MTTILSKTAREALSIGSNKFYTGRPCKNGHLTYRYAVSGGCSECINPSTGNSGDPLYVVAKNKADTIVSAAQAVALALNGSADALREEAAKVVAEAQAQAAALMSEYRAKKTLDAQNLAIEMQTKLVALGEMTQQGFRIHEGDLDNFVRIALGYARLSNKHFTERDIFPNRRASSKNELGGWYKFQCVPVDIEHLVIVAKQLTDQRFPPKESK